MQLVKKTKSTFQGLQLNVDALNAKLEGLKAGLDGNNNEATSVALRALQFAQWKFDLHWGILEEFKEMFETSQAQHKVVVEKVLIVKKVSQEVIKWHKIYQRWQLVVAYRFNSWSKVGHHL